MPIANCIITPDCPPGNGDPIALWAREAGLSPQHMTINLVAGARQFGVACPVMADLLLPTLWSPADLSRLQTGLARALAEYFGLDIEQVQVTTRTVESGRVVEAGRVVDW